MKFTEDMTSEMIEELELLNPEGLGLIEMFQEYLETDKKSKAYEALKYYLSLGPVADSIKKKFDENMDLETFFIMVRDCNDYCRPEKEFFEESYKKIMDEFCTLDEKGQYVQRETFKIVSNSSKSKIIFKLPICLPRKKIVDEFHVTESYASKVLDDSFGMIYMKLLYNKLICEEINANIPELEKCTRFEWDINNFSYSTRNAVLSGDLSLSIAPSRVTEKTLNGIQKLLEKFGAM